MVGQRLTTACGVLGLVAILIWGCGDRSGAAPAPAADSDTQAPAGGKARATSASAPGAPGLASQSAGSSDAVATDAGTPPANLLATAVENSNLEPDLFVVYTASSQGYLEPCGCYVKKKEMGGIARRATYVDSLRTTGTPVLLLEAGDFVGGPGEAGNVIGEVSLKAMKAMGYDAVGLGEAELMLGEGFLAKAGQIGPPLAHANWSHPSVGPAQKEGLVVEKAGHKIGVIGLIDPALLPKDLPVENLSMYPPGPVAAAAAASLRAAGADLIVVLGHGDFRSSGRILPLAGAPDLWVVGHGGKELSQPYRFDNTLLLGSGNGGKMVGALGLAFPEESAAQYSNLLYPLHLTIPEKPAIAALVKSVGPEILHRRGPEDADS
jgi:2',3'-cyclic-nucleotide 2'-phosphodiesterase (5'-nucleotidase family)